MPLQLLRGIRWIRGQLEQGGGGGLLSDVSTAVSGESSGGIRPSGGFRHWQICVAFDEKRTLQQVRDVFGRSCHAELSRSEAATAYVWKDATSLGQRFELGAKPIRRNSKTDWESVWNAAKLGDLNAIPANVRVVSYRTLRAIAADHDSPEPMERIVNVFWGSTGTGKSRRAWEEAGLGAYCKDPRSKFWCGYTAEEDVVIDEFRGGIDISHLLRWFDRYPVRVEIKGSSRPLCARRIWITSNLDPRYWYPDVDDMTLNALLRRLAVINFDQ